MDTALYSLSLPAFQSAIEQHLSRALPKVSATRTSPDPAFAAASATENERHGDSAQKSLPELLSNLGNPVSCPFCSVPLAKGTTARLCLACGKALGPLPAGTSDCWRSSRAQHMFLASHGLSSDSLEQAVPTSVTADGNTAVSTPLISDDFAAPELLSDDRVKLSSPGRQLSAPRLSMFAQNSGPLAAPSAIESSNGSEDFFSQLVGLEAAVDSRADPSPSISRPSKAVVPDRKAEVLHRILEDLPDFSFMLSDHLVLKEQNLRTATSAATSSATSAATSATFETTPAPPSTSASLSSPSTYSASAFFPASEAPTSASATYSADPDPFFTTKDSLTPTPTHVPLQETLPLPLRSRTPLVVMSSLNEPSITEPEILEPSVAHLNATKEASMITMSNCVPFVEEKDVVKNMVQGDNDEEDSEWGDFAS